MYSLVDRRAVVNRRNRCDIVCGYASRDVRARNVCVTNPIARGLQRLRRRPRRRRHRPSRPRRDDWQRGFHSSSPRVLWRRPQTRVRFTRGRVRSLRRHVRPGDGQRIHGEQRRRHRVRGEARRRLRHRRRVRLG